MLLLITGNPNSLPDDEVQGAGALQSSPSPQILLSNSRSAGDSPTGLPFRLVDTQILIGIMIGNRLRSRQPIVLPSVAVHLAQP